MVRSVVVHRGTGGGGIKASAVLSSERISLQRAVARAVEVLERLASRVAHALVVFDVGISWCST